MPTLAIIWQRFGPYHLARLRGANLAFQQEGGSCVGIEVAGRDQYAWEQSSEKGVGSLLPERPEGCFAQKTPDPFFATGKLSLFPDAQYEQLARRDIRQAVNSCLNDLRPEAVAVNGWSVAEALAATDWCRQNDCPAILMSETHESSGQIWKELVKRSRVSNCDAALVGGRWHADYLASLGFPRAGIVIGYDAVDNEHFAAGAAEARGERRKKGEELKLPEQYFYANTRFLPRKNVDGLLRAYARYWGKKGTGTFCRNGREKGVRSLLPERPEGCFAQNTPDPIFTPWDLVITGSGQMEAEWKNLATTLGIEEFVHWHGFVQYQELPSYYGLASAFVHPAKREAWGLVINEACAAGLPVIVGNRVGAACELVEQGSNGYAVDADDVDEIAQAMLRITEVSDSQRQAMGRRSQQLVSQFTPERFGEAMRRAYHLARESDEPEKESRHSHLATSN